MEIANYSVILEEKAIFLINKGSSGDWEMWRVTIWRPFSIPRSALDCFQRTPTQSYQPKSITLHRTQRYKDFLKPPNFQPLYMRYPLPFFLFSLCSAVTASSSGTSIQSNFFTHRQTVTRESSVMLCICGLERPIRIR